MLSSNCCCTGRCKVWPFTCSGQVIGQLPSSLDPKRDMRLRDEEFDRRRREEWLRINEPPRSLPPGVTKVSQDYSGRWRVRVRAGSSPA